MKFQDYYEILGVSRTASEAEIKSAYRKLAKEWHPDRHQGKSKATAEDKFKRISEAYTVLSDADTRKKYDQFGEHWQHGQEFRPPPGGAGGGPRAGRGRPFAHAGGNGGEGFGFSDFFSSLFGEDYAERFGGRGARGAQTRFRRRGEDVRAVLELPVSLAVAGGKRSFEIAAEVPCAQCSGAGNVDGKICPACGGLGSHRQMRSVDLTIPAHARDGMTLRLKGLGERGSDGEPTGDLYLTLKLASDSTYRVLEDGDLEAEVPVAPWEALDGAKADVATPDGVLTVKIPPGTRAGARLRLAGKGLDDGSGGRGDLFLAVRLALPDDLDEAKRQTLRDLGKGASPPRGGARR